MRVQLLQDYRGKLTEERYYQTGETVDLPEAAAGELAQRGIVVLLEKPATVGKSKVK
jgi:hypothetical protein